MGVQQVVRVTRVDREEWIYLMDFSLEGGTSPRKGACRSWIFGFIIVLVFLSGITFFSGFLFDDRGTNLFVLLFPLFHL